MDAHQHQSPKQQLVQGLRNLFPDKTSAWRAQAALAVGQLQEDVAAGLVSVDAEDRRATIEAAVAGRRGWFPWFFCNCLLQPPVTITGSLLTGESVFHAAATKVSA